MKKLMLVVTVAVVLSSAAYGDILHVDEDVDVDATGYVGDGSSWYDAFPALYSAIDVAEPWDRIWVAEGVYTQGTPEPSTQELINVPDRVRLYGGFDGSETSFSQRDWEANETILDASEAAPGDVPTDHVVVMEKGVTHTRVDGFTITGGIADGGVDDSIGGGIYCSDIDNTNVIANCTIMHNTAEISGAGISCSYASPQIVNCTVTDNDGTGIYSESFSSPSIDGSTISDNLGRGLDFFAECYPSFTNCVISGNNEEGIYGEGSDLLITNCTVAGNAVDGIYLTSFDWAGTLREATAVIYNTIIEGHGNNGIYEADEDSDASAVNCLFFGNKTDFFDEGLESYGDEVGNDYSFDEINGSNIVEAFNNIQGDPMFLHAGRGDYHLTYGSLCIDAGAGYEFSGVPTTDIDGEARPVGDWYDIGADEFVDTNGDGVSDYEENIPDSDGDGYIDDIETDAGTDPDDPDDYPLWYVDPDAVGAGDGSSWLDAFTTIQPAIDAADFAVGGGEVWVADGTYTAGTPEPNTTTLVAMFTMKKNVNVYGGFEGLDRVPAPEALLSERNFEFGTNVTVLDGSADPLYHIVLGARNAILDGFTITGGSTAWNDEYESHTRSGGGIYNTSSYMTVRNCTIAANTAELSGGGIYNSASSLTVENCVFTDNSTSGGGSAGLGGGLCNDGGSATITNCIFTGNDALDVLYAYGGGIANINSSPTIMNCTFSQNSAKTSAGGIFNWGSSAPTVTNSILWDDLPNEIGNSGGGTATVTYSDVQGGYGETEDENIDQNPIFLLGPSGTSTGLSYNPATNQSTLTDDGASFADDDLIGAVLWVGPAGSEEAYYILDNDGTTITVWGDATEGGSVSSPADYAVNYYSLQDDSSPCVDTGTWVGAPAQDIVGTGRPQGGDVDMGAYELLAVGMDSDGDGIPNEDEGPADPDGDGDPNYDDNDSDGDGIDDIDETTVDTDDDGTPNFLDDDSDGDGISDSDEGIPGYLVPDPDNDRDHDGLSNDVEGGEEIDSDGDGIPNYLDPDSDNDGVRDGREVNTDGTDHLRPENLRIDGILGGVADTRSGLRVDFPAGFLASGYILADITIPDPAPSGPVPTGLWLTGNVFELEPAGSVFDLRATVTVVYDEPYVPRVDESTLTPAYWTGTEYSREGLELVSLDTDTNTLVFTTTHSGVFELLARLSVELEGTPATSWFGLGILCLVVAATALFVRKRSGIDKEGQTPSKETS